MTKAQSYRLALQIRAALIVVRAAVVEVQLLRTHLHHTARTPPTVATVGRRAVLDAAEIEREAAGAVLDRTPLPLLQDQILHQILAEDVRSSHPKTNVVVAHPPKALHLMGRGGKEQDEMMTPEIMMGIPRLKHLILEVKGVVYQSHHLLVVAEGKIGNVVVVAVDHTLPHALVPLLVTRDGLKSHHLPTHLSMKSCKSMNERKGPDHRPIHDHHHHLDHALHPSEKSLQGEARTVVMIGSAVEGEEPGLIAEVYPLVGSKLFHCSQNKMA